MYDLVELKKNYRMIEDWLLIRKNISDVWFGRTQKNNIEWLWETYISNVWFGRTQKNNIEWLWINWVLIWKILHDWLSIWNYTSDE